MTSNRLVQQGARTGPHGGDVLIAGYDWIAFAQSHSVDLRYEQIETAPGWRKVEDITLSEGRRIALACEVRAAAYVRQVASVFEGSQARFFLDLAADEDNHARMVEEVFVRTRVGSRA